MRAIYMPDFNGEVGDELPIIGDNFHHLKNVVRIRKTEELLLLNGRGGKAVAQVISIEKREVIVKVISVEEVKDSSKFDVLFCLTKKQSVELAIKMAVELNISQFFLVESEYSQRKNALKIDRVDSLLESAMIQSNAAYLTKVSLLDSFSTFMESHASNYDEIHAFDLTSTASASLKKSEKHKLIVIGPEGGFSPIERELLANSSKCHIHYLPLNIMRAPTAMSTAVGYLLGLENV